MISDMECKMLNIVAAFRRMHVSPAKHIYAWLPRKCDYRTDGRTERQTPDKVIPMCRYASQATQKYCIFEKSKYNVCMFRERRQGNLGSDSSTSENECNLKFLHSQSHWSYLFYIKWVKSYMYWWNMSMNIQNVKEAFNPELNFSVSI